MKKITFLLFLLTATIYSAQDLSQGYIANDLSPQPMQAVSKPAYLGAFIDPSFSNTTIIRISDAGLGNFTVPMYSTIQAWNADETYIILYSSSGNHQLLNGQNYTFIRNLTDISPDDIETIFWHFTDPDILFYHESSTNDFIRYNVVTQTKTIVVNFTTITGCNSGISLGDDVQMMSWDSDVVSFRCDNLSAYYYRISTNTLTQFNITNIANTAPMPFPSGNLFFHTGSVYDANGNFVMEFNIDAVEHSCLGKLSNGDDAYFAIAFEEGPNGGCQGTLVAHNATNGNCHVVTSYTDYGYPQSGTHISALAHKNNEGGWVAVSMMGFDLNGQDLLDQEMFIAKVNETDGDVYRVAHHRSDEDEFKYFGEPHVTISPSGTRLLFGSDWSGTDDGISVESYVAELESYNLRITEPESAQIKIHPNPTSNFISINKTDIIESYQIISLDGKIIDESYSYNYFSIDVRNILNGIYFLNYKVKGVSYFCKFVKQQ